MSWPQMRIVPPVFMTSPAMMLISVDLPAPLGPSRPKMPPSGTSKLTPLSASLGGASPCAAYSLTRSRISIAALRVCGHPRPLRRAGATRKGRMVARRRKGDLNHVPCGAFTGSPARPVRMRLGYFRQPRLPGRLSLRQRAAGALLALLALGCPVPALAQQVTRQPDRRCASGHPRTAVRCANIADMDFGRIAQPDVAGTVTLSPRRRPDLHHQRRNRPYRRLPAGPSSRSWAARTG